MKEYDIEFTIKNAKTIILINGKREKIMTTNSFFDAIKDLIK